MTGTRPSQWNGDATGTLTMIWERFFGDVTDVLVVSLTCQSRWEGLRSVIPLSLFPMHRCHVHVDTGTSPSMLGRPRRCWDVPVTYDDKEVKLYSIDSQRRPFTSGFRTLAPFLYFVDLVVKYAARFSSVSPRRQDSPSQVEFQCNLGACTSVTY